MPLTRDQLLKGPTVKVESVSVPELPNEGHVHIREWLAREFTKIDALAGATQGPMADRLKAVAEICVMSICDEAGELVLAADDAETLMNWPYPPLERIALAAMKLNGLDTSPEESEGNLPDGRSESLP